jgi:hypothetical protein
MTMTAATLKNGDSRHPNMFGADHGCTTGLRNRLLVAVDQHV